MSKENITEQMLNSEQYKELPGIVDRPYPYVVIGDISDVTKRITDRPDINVEFFQDKLYSMFKTIMPEKSTFYSVSADKINFAIEKIVKSEIENPFKKVGVVNLDRYLCSNIKSDSIFQINISRDINGGLIARPGETTSPEDQIKNLMLWSIKNNFRELIIIDDVLAFGDTLVPFIKGLQKETPNTKVKVLVGLASSGGSWRGIERVREETGIISEFITLIEASDKRPDTSGMAIPTSRDFTFLGGKVSKIENNVLSYPYFLPFSVPVGSFMPKEQRVKNARDLLALNRSLEHTSAEFWGGI
jgi:hypothetical protein